LFIGAVYVIAWPDADVVDDRTPGPPLPNRLTDHVTSPENVGVPMTVAVTCVVLPGLRSAMVVGFAVTVTPVTRADVTGTCTLALFVGSNRERAVSVTVVAASTIGATNTTPWPDVCVNVAHGAGMHSKRPDDALQRMSSTNRPAVFVAALVAVNVARESDNIWAGLDGEIVTSVMAMH
jgi:hypothetical protein